MSITDASEESAVPIVGEPGSIAERIARRRRSLEQRRQSVITVPVNGFEKLLAAQYRRLSAEVKGDIANKHQRVGEDTGDAVAASADTLIRACVDLLEVTGFGENDEPQYRALGKRWTTSAVTELFELDLPEAATSRTALMAALDSQDLLDHFLAYDTEVKRLDKDEAEELPGESEPSEEG